MFIISSHFVLLWHTLEVIIVRVVNIDKGTKECPNYLVKYLGFTLHLSALLQILLWIPGRKRSAAALSNLDTLPCLSLSIFTDNTCQSKTKWLPIMNNNEYMWLGLSLPQEDVYIKFWKFTFKFNKRIKSNLSNLKKYCTRLRGMFKVYGKY